MTDQHPAGGPVPADAIANLIEKTTGKRPKSVTITDPQPAGQAPVTGYTKQDPFKVDIVNGIKDTENTIGDLLATVSEMYGIDPRMLALARTNLQQGFMWLVRSVFQPESRL